MMGISVWKLLLILAVILLVFGGRRLPELGRGLGLGLSNFKKSFHNPEADQDRAGTSSPTGPSADA